MKRLYKSGLIALALIASTTQPMHNTHAHTTRSLFIAAGSQPSRTSVVLRPGGTNGSVQYGPMQSVHVSNYQGQLLDQQKLLDKHVGIIARLSLSGVVDNVELLERTIKNCQEELRYIGWDPVSLRDKIVGSHGTGAGAASLTDAEIGHQQQNLLGSNQQAKLCYEKIELYKKCIEYNNQRIAELKKEVAAAMEGYKKEVSSVIDNKPGLVENVAELQEINTQLKKDVAAGQTAMTNLDKNSSGYVDQIKKLQETVSAFQHKIALNDAKIEYLQKNVERINTNMLAEVEKLFSHGSGVSLTDNDAQLKDAIKASYSGTQKIIEPQKLLAERTTKTYGISDRDSASFAATPYQEYLTTRICDQLNSLAENAPDETSSYNAAAAQAYIDTLNIIRTGTPKDALLSFQQSNLLFRATCIAIAATKGAIEGALIGAAVNAGLVMFPVAGKYIICSLVGYNLIKLINAPSGTMAKAWGEFWSQPLEHQVEHFASLIGGWKAPTLSSQTAQHIRACIKQELMHLKNAGIEALNYAKTPLLSLIKDITRTAEKMGKTWTPEAVAVASGVEIKIAHAAETAAAEATAAGLSKTEQLVAGETAGAGSAASKTAQRVEGGAGVAGAGSKGSVGATIEKEFTNIIEGKKCTLEEYCDLLSRDPSHGNLPTFKGKEEALAGIAAEIKGVLKGPLRRDPTGAAEFIDATGKAWDVKKAISHAPNGKYIFDGEHLLKKIKQDLELNENILLDITKLEKSDLLSFITKLKSELSKFEMSKIVVISKSSLIESL